MELSETHVCCQGEQRRYRHQSQALGCSMHFSLFLPPHWRAETPVLFWLSGLTCTDQNFVFKAGAQRWAAQAGLALLAPDTSPRGDQVADVDDQALGQGAGFYLDACEQPWAKHYKMESYLTQELPELLGQLGLKSANYGISGHSMGGHGALILFLRHPDLFHSVSAFAPISHPSRSAWGRQAFQAYLGADEERWQQHDATCLIRQRPPRGTTIRVDVGMNDEFWDDLQVTALIDAARSTGTDLDLRLHGGYDHSYFFVASFIRQHLFGHARLLQNLSFG